MFKSEAGILLDIFVVREVKHALHNILHAIILENHILYTIYAMRRAILQILTVVANASHDIAC